MPPKQHPFKPVTYRKFILNYIKKNRFNLLISLPVLSIVLLYIWVISSAKLGWGGLSPAETQLVTIPDYIPPPQLCDGVKITPKGIWLVQHTDESALATALAANPPAFDFMKLVDEKQSIFSAGMHDNSTVLRIASSDGQVRVAGALPQAECLDYSFDGQTVWMRTILSPIDKSNSVNGSVVFRSDDQGKSWQLEPNAFGPVAGAYPHSYQILFPNAKDRWVVYSPRFSGNMDMESELSPNKVFVAYTGDQGKSWQTLVTVNTLPLPAQIVNDLQKRGNPQLFDRRTYVTPLSDRQVLVWQTGAMGRQDAELNVLEKKHFTSLQSLTRKHNSWVYSPSTISAEQNFKTIEQGTDGQIFAVSEFGDELWQYQLTSKRWEKRSSSPSLFSPFPDRSFISTLRVGNGLLFIEINAKHIVPTWLYPWEEASISASGYFYSTDNGKSWQQFHLTDNATIAGFDAQKNRVLVNHTKGGGYDEIVTTITAQQLGK